MVLSAHSFQLPQVGSIGWLNTAHWSVIGEKVLGLQLQLQCKGGLIPEVSIY